MLFELVPQCNSRGPGDESFQGACDVDVMAWAQGGVSEWWVVG
jgi:hypothetical protein